MSYYSFRSPRLVHPMWSPLTALLLSWPNLSWDCTKHLHSLSPLSHITWRRSHHLITPNTIKLRHPPPFSITFVLPSSLEVSILVSHVAWKKLCHHKTVDCLEVVEIFNLVESSCNELCFQSFKSVVRVIFVLDDPFWCDDMSINDVNPIFSRADLGSLGLKPCRKLGKIVKKGELESC